LHHLGLQVRDVGELGIEPAVAVVTDELGKLLLLGLELNAVLRNTRRGIPLVTAATHSSCVADWPVSRKRWPYFGPSSRR